MLPLDKDLQQKKSSLSEFESIVFKVLNYLQSVLSGFEEKGDYILYYSAIASTKKFVRPINKRLFTMDVGQFSQNFAKLQLILNKARNKDKGFSEEEKLVIDSTLYTIQQAIGAGFDLLGDPNSARKHVGNRFEELIKAVFTEMGVPNKKVVIKIPYETADGKMDYYKCENDLILSPYPDLPSDNNKENIVLEPVQTLPDRSPDDELVLLPDSEEKSEKYINESEIVVSVKTTSKDRMGKMFMDKILLERFVKHDLKVIGIFLNDVQRKESNNISFTLVSGLFMVYNQFITQLEGVYYLDPPPTAYKEPYNKHIKKFSELITQDIYILLTA